MELKKLKMNLFVKSPYRWNYSIKIKTKEGKYISEKPEDEDIDVIKNKKLVKSNGNKKGEYLFKKDGKWYIHKIKRKTVEIHPYNWNKKLKEITIKAMPLYTDKPPYKDNDPETIMEKLKKLKDR